MDESRATPKAVVLSAVLHIGIVGFLFLAVLPCASYESFFNALHLPAWMNPITCTAPLKLQGPIIEATLIGPTGSPPPKAVKVKPVPNTVPPPPTVTPPKPTPEKPAVSQLPPPPKHPDTVDQERVVEDAALKAEEAKKVQEEKERQRQAELDAQAAKKKEEERKKLDAIFAKMAAASAQTRQLDNKAKQAQQQLADLKNAQDNARSDLPDASQLQTGNNSPDSDLSSEYAAANAGTLYTAKGTAAMLVPLASVLSHQGGWSLVFTVAAVLTVAAGLSAKFLLQPMRRRFITGHAAAHPTMQGQGAAP